MGTPRHPAQPWAASLGPEKLLPVPSAQHFPRSLTLTPLPKATRCHCGQGQQPRQQPRRPGFKFQVGAHCLMAYKATEGPGLSRPLCKRGRRTRLGCGACAGGRAGALEVGTWLAAPGPAPAPGGCGEAAQRTGPVAATHSAPDAASRSAPWFGSEK